MKKTMSDQMVFGLDIGTRSIVGTVGMKQGDRFVVMGQSIREHKTRAMLDGQIHDIEAVSETIKEVKKELEDTLGMELRRVCIAAAGRVLITMQHTVEMTFSQERTVTEDDINNLDMMGTQQAYDKFQKEHKGKEKFYCVGYSVIRYYMNGNQISNLENHKAYSIKEDLIATFLPNDVVDGLNKAVELAGLEVANMTLEPIAAIEVAIPVNYRMLNLALVDVGAGTSDICITKDGSITAYGMIPIAGDCLTECIAQHCLVDFNTAEFIKKEVELNGQATYKDIMGLEMTVTLEEVGELLDAKVSEMAKKVADKIVELNGKKSVSAVFVVGGGGRVPGYTKKLSEYLNIQNQRVAVRGEDVMTNVEFPEGMRKDSLMVTPIGICLNYYEQANNFIMISFNGKQMRLYDNAHLVVADAAIQAEFPNVDLFPKRGKELNYKVNKKARVVRGLPGESASITINGEIADIHSPIHGKDVVVVKKSTAGAAASLTLNKIPEMDQKLEIIVMGALVEIPVCARVNGVLESPEYSVQEGDKIEIRNYYTLGDLLKYLDMNPGEGVCVLVNNQDSTNETKVYSNFTVTFSDKTVGVKEEETKEENVAEDLASAEDTYESDSLETSEESTEEKKAKEEPAESKEPEKPVDMFVTVNRTPVKLTGKASYVFANIFDYYSFDLNAGKGREIITKLNGEPAQFMKTLSDGDVIELYWKEEK